MLRLLAVEQEVTELGVRNQLAVEEQARADPRAEREHDDDTIAAAPGAITHLGEAGGVRVVDHVDRLARGGGEHGIDVRADPRLVDVRRGPGDPVADHRRKGHADVAFPVEVLDELTHDVGHRLRASTASGVRILCRSAVSVPVRRSTGAAFIPEPPMSMPNAIDGCDSELTIRTLRRPTHHRPRERPMISFMISVVPP